MIGYIFIFISVFFGITKGFCSKKVSGSVKTLRDNLDINLYRNVICCILSLITVLIFNDINLRVSAAELIICAISGISMAIFISSWIFAIKTDAYMLVSACASSSFIIPAILGVFFLGEKLTIMKGAAFIIIIAALYFLLRYNTKLNGKLTPKAVLLLAIIMTSQGINQSMQKIYTYYIPHKDVSYYTLFASIFTVLAILFMIPFAKKDPETKKATVLLDFKVIVYTSFMALALFGNTYFLALAAKSVDAIILYPVANALSLAGAGAMSAIFFGEKMNRDSIIGIILVFIALILSR